MLSTDYEVKGMENIPDKGQGVLLVYYHGAIPIDLYYMQANLYLAKGQTCKSIVDNFVLKFPGCCLFIDYKFMLYTIFVELFKVYIILS